MTEKLGYINNYTGVVISLNQKKMPYFGVGRVSPSDFKIWLTPKKWCTQIPDNLTIEEADQIDSAIRDGILVLGKQYIPVADKDKAILKEYIDTLKEARMLTQPVKDKFINLVRKKVDGNYSASEILIACLNIEKGRNRPDFIKFLEEGLKVYEGPAYFIEDFSNSPEVEYVNYTYVEVNDEPLEPQEKETVKKKASTKVKKDKLLDEFLGKEL